MKVRQAIWCGLLVCFLAACGPMNKAPEGLSNPSSGPLNPSGATQITQKSLFVVHVVNETAKSSKSIPPGENIYSVRGAKADLSALLSAAKVSFVYWMPEMPDMGKFDEVGQKQADGSYKGSLIFSMRGHWEVNVKIEDGANQDLYVFNVYI